MPLETKLKVAGQGGDQCFQKQKRPKASLRPCDGLSDAYFLAVQVGQVAQVALLSVQHFMPQAAVAFLAVQHFLVAQPATKAEAQTIRARSLMDFIVCYFIF